MTHFNESTCHKEIFLFLGILGTACHYCNVLLVASHMLEVYDQRMLTKGTFVVSPSSNH